MDERAASLLRLLLVERTAGEIAFLEGERRLRGAPALSALEMQDHLGELEGRGWAERGPQGGRWRITEAGRQELLTFGRWEIDIERVVSPPGEGRAVGHGAVRGGLPSAGDRFKVNRAGDAEPPVGEVRSFRQGSLAAGRERAEVEVAWVDLAPGDVLVRWEPLVEGPAAPREAAGPERGAGSLAAFTFPGTYQDPRGLENIVWQVRSRTNAAHPIPRFEIQTTVRGVEVEGLDFDGLEPVDRGAATAAGLSGGPDLRGCVLGGHLPCVVEHEGQRERLTVSFRLDLATSAERSPPKHLQLRTSSGSTSVQVDDDCFEVGLRRLDAMLPSGHRLVCCLTCLYSDYSPYGNGLTGMSCHRGAKEAYLAVRSRYEYRSVPVTETVLETHLCDQYERRVPGTRHRG